MFESTLMIKVLILFVPQRYNMYACFLLVLFQLIFKKMNGTNAKIKKNAFTH